MPQFAIDHPVNLALRRVVTPECFDPIFREGTKLIEDAAELPYAPGSPMRDSVVPFRGIAFLTAHGRLTRALINMGSWLTAHRALSQRQVDFAGILSDPRRPRLYPLSPMGQEESEMVPPAFLDVVRRTERLHARLLVIERSLYGPGGAAADVRTRH